MIKVQFKQWYCNLSFGFYQENHRIAITLTEVGTGEPILTASVNIDSFSVPDNHVLIKNYSENEGVLDVLVQAGVLEDTGLTVQTGHVEVPLCKILKTAN